MRFTHLRLLVLDYRTSFYFYTKLLGFKCMWGDLESGYADLKTGNTLIALYSRGDMANAIGTADLPAKSEAQDAFSIVLEVDSVDRVAKSLKANGVEFETEPEDRIEWGIRTAHLRDPDGNLLELYEMLPES